MSYKDNNTEIAIQSFKKTFETENLVDMLSQAGEIGLDYTLDIVDSAQILKDIPVLGLIVSGTKTIANIRNYFLAKKGLAEAFESAGLVYQSIVGGGNAASDSKSGTKMRLSPTGRILLAYGLNVEVETHAPRTTDVRGSLNWETLDDVEAFTVKK